MDSIYYILSGVVIIGFFLFSFKEFKKAFKDHEERRAALLERKNQEKLVIALSDERLLKVFNAMKYAPEDVKDFDTNFVDLVTSEIYYRGLDEAGKTS